MGGNRLVTRTKRVIEIIKWVVIYTKWGGREQMGDRDGEGATDK